MLNRMETANLHATSHIQDRSTPFEKNICNHIDLNWNCNFWTRK